MENQQGKIDEIFRQRLQNAEVPPPPFVWPAVEYELQKRKRRVLALWLFALGTVAVFAGLWKADLWSNLTPGTVLTPAAELQKDVQAAQTIETTVGAPEIIPTPTVETSVGPKEALVSSSVRQPTRTAEQQQSGALRTESRDIASGKGIRGSEATLVPATDFAQAAPTGKTTLSGSLETQNPKANLQIEAPIDLKNLQIYLQENRVTSLQPGILPAPSTFKAISRRKKEQPRVCYDFSRHPSAWLIDVYAGPSLAQRSLTSRFDDQPYLNQRLTTERQSTAINAGLRASLMFNSNFLVRTGLNYDQVSEIFEYIDPAYTKYRIEVTVLSNGMTHVDTVGVDYGENYLKTYNRYAMLDLPLLVGMEMRKGRSGFSINAGISANLLFETRGVIIDPQTHEPARFGPIPEKPKGVGPKSTLNQAVFRTNVGLSASASIQYYWHLSRNFRVFIEPSFRQVLRPVTVENHPVEQRYSIFGLRLGATRIF
jgi:hypothetical protein